VTSPVILIRSSGVPKLVEAMWMKESYEPTIFANDSWFSKSGATSLLAGRPRFLMIEPCLQLSVLQLGVFVPRLGPMAS